MTILNQVRNFLVKKFWPWFIQHVWPKLQSIIISIVVEAFDNLRKKISDYLSSQAESQREEYRQKAADAEQQADSTTDDVAAAKWKAKAEAYYEFAKELKHENEKLRHDIEEEIRTSAQKAKSDISSLDIEQTDSAVLVGGRDLPSLPKSIPEKGTE